MLRLAARLNVVNQLYERFLGDLRGLVKALEDLLLTLRRRNQTELQEQLGETAWDRLLTWAQVDAASVQTQAELVELWQVRQPTVSQTLQPLMEAGAVEALHRPGAGRPIRHLTTGTARLAPQELGKRHQPVLAAKPGLLSSARLIASFTDHAQRWRVARGGTRCIGSHP